MVAMAVFYVAKCNYLFFVNHRYIFTICEYKTAIDLYKAAIFKNFLQSS